QRRGRRDSAEVSETSSSDCIWKSVPPPARDKDNLACNHRRSLKEQAADNACAVARNRAREQTSHRYQKNESPVGRPCRCLDVCSKNNAAPLCRIFARRQERNPAV